MDFLNLVYAPNPIFKQKAQPVEKVDQEINLLIDKMFKTLYLEKGIGLAANMVGVLKRIIVIDIFENGCSSPLCFINPEITWKSQETQSFEEASLSFPSISAKIERSKAIKLDYLDRKGGKKTFEAEGFLATVIQHEYDYLEGVVYIDYLSPLKQKMLLKKMQKHLKAHPPHIHNAGCRH